MIRGLECRHVPFPLLRAVRWRLANNAGYQLPQPDWHARDIQASDGISTLL